MSIYNILKPLVMSVDPELSHNLVIKLLKAYSKLTPCSSTFIKNPVNAMGLRFANPIGCAAGFDKNAEVIDGLSHFGFGFIEVGSLTPKPQSGNDKPRVFRLPQDQAIINRYGFNNVGIIKAIDNIKKRKSKVTLGINIGKNKLTSDDNAHLDYKICMEHALAYADYITINLSSPNTPGLRKLQHGIFLEKILTTAKLEQEKYQQQTNHYVPIVLKVSPDMNNLERQEIASIILANDIDGLIVSNTSSDRVGIMTKTSEVGGLSGNPLFSLSHVGVVEFAKLLQGKVTIIASGGIDSSEKAKLMLDSGASLLQLYTALVYKGPILVKDILNNI